MRKKSIIYDKKENIWVLKNIKKNSKQKLKKNQIIIEMKFIQEIQSFMSGNKNNNSRGKNDFAKKMDICHWRCHIYLI